MQSSLTMSASTVRFRSRTPGPEDHRSLRSSTLGNSSDCIYSLLGDSLSGLNLLSPQSPHRRYPYNDRLATNWSHLKNQIPGDHPDAVDLHGRMGAYPGSEFTAPYTKFRSSCLSSESVVSTAVSTIPVTELFKTRLSVFMSLMSVKTPSNKLMVINT
ncbi:unnamed protein product [Dibothriocephalus latus]|uniref:Uncharacterized protein n=1 Tax=Dibothriocephalus latus TaxID=60516 RepID=A0A3P7LNB7_DIBLA|nr:unnamed protein product [Dibothriocephalus latus]